MQDELSLWTNDKLDRYEMQEKTKKRIRLPMYIWGYENMLNIRFKIINYVKKACTILDWVRIFLNSGQ